MYPCVFGGFDLKPERFQSLLFTYEIGEGYLECDVVNSGCCRLWPTITGVL